MKQFFKFMFASMLGFMLSVVALFLLFVGIVASIASSFESAPKTEVKDNSILRIDLGVPVPDRTPKNPFANFNFGNEGEEEGDEVLGLSDVLANIKKAKEDSHIKGIFLDLDMTSMGMANAEEIRNALIDFKKSGKFVVAYGEIITQGAYYMASVADKIYLNPAGDMLLNGFSAQMLYMKKALDKLGVEAQVIKHGRFKSAAETLVEDKMSDENRKQVEAYVGAMYEHFISGIATARKKSEAEVYDVAEHLKIQNPEDAKALGFVDGILFRDQVMDELGKMLKLSEGTDPVFVNLGKYHHTEKKGSSAKEKIAVIYAVGDITGAEADEENIGSDDFVKTIRKVRNDKNVKAVVLRVNSPGGSALASDVILRELQLTKKVKPIIVSMGNVAASGGYFISLAADTIVAEPNTITGSIGVIGVMMNAQKLMNDKLGLSIDGVKFGKYSDLGRVDRPLTEDEKAIIQKAIDRIYGDFIGKVAASRRLSVAAVDSLAQGRVWAGSDALKMGLVDVMGGLNDAIAIAARKAGLKDYRLESLPEIKDPFELIMKSFSGATQEMMLKAELGENYHWYLQMKRAMKYQGIQARMPYELQIQ